MIELGFCVALMAATSWAVLAAGFVNGGGGAIVAGVAAVLAAAALARAHIHRIATALACPLLAAVVIVPVSMAWMPAGSHQAFGVTASHYLGAMTTGTLVHKRVGFHCWSLSNPVCLRILARLDIGSRASRRARRCVPMFTVLAVDVLNAPRAAALALPVTLAMGLSLAVIAAAYLGSLTARWTRKGIAPLEGLRWTFASSAAPVAAGIHGGRVGAPRDQHH